MTDPFVVSCPHGPWPKRLGLRRSDLPTLCRSLDMKRGAEIGVWKGDLSVKFCAAGLEWIAVDAWSPLPGWEDARNDAAALVEAKRIAWSRLKRYRKCRILEMTSAEAAAVIPDKSLDLVYIDADHGYEAVIRDLDLWTPKIRPGGFIGGHDYSEAVPSIHVKAAVTDYVSTRGIAPWFVLEGDRVPSYLWRVA